MIHYPNVATLVVLHEIIIVSSICRSLHGFLYLHAFSVGLWGFNKFGLNDFIESDIELKQCMLE